MATKIKRTYTIDSKVEDEFAKVCKQNKKHKNEIVEILMKLYIEKQGKILLDDIYAPRVDALLSRRLDKVADQIKGMINNVNVDILATQFLVTGALKKSLLGFEDIIAMYFADELLNPDRGSIANSYKAIEDANKLLPGSRNAARKQIAMDKKERAEAKKKEES